MDGSCWHITFCGRHLKDLSNQVKLTQLYFAINLFWEPGTFIKMLFILAEFSRHCNDSQLSPEGGYQANQAHV